MRVLFIESDPIWIYGFPEGFVDAGHDILVTGPVTDEKLSRQMTDFAPDLVVTMGWGPENTSILKQDWIRKYTRAAGVPHVYWATEDPTHTRTFSLPYIRRVKPDFVFTICPRSIQEYRAMGVAADRMDFAYHERVHHRTVSDPRYQTSLAVVANAYPNVLATYPQHFRHRSLHTLIRPLLEAGIQVDFYGAGWDLMESHLGLQIPHAWIHGPIAYEETRRIYSSADIIVGLQNHRTQLTQRTYEILGSGGFLLTHDTPEIRRLFVPDEDLVVSDQAADTVERVTYYLQHPMARERIRQHGQSTVASHTYRHRAERMLEVLEAARIVQYLGHTDGGEYRATGRDVNPGHPWRSKQQTHRPHL